MKSCYCSASGPFVKVHVITRRRTDRAHVRVGPHTVGVHKPVFLISWGQSTWPAFGDRPPQHRLPPCPELLPALRPPRGLIPCPQLLLPGNSLHPTGLKTCPYPEPCLMSPARGTGKVSWPLRRPKLSPLPGEPVVDTSAQ